MVKAGLTHAAQQGRIYHLWWHPHNFGLDLPANKAMLEEILRQFEQLRAAEGMVSQSMADLVASIRPPGDQHP